MTPPRRLVSVRLLAAAALFVMPALIAPGAGAMPLPAAPPGATLAAVEVPAALVTTSRGRRAVRWENARSHWPSRHCLNFVRTALSLASRYGTPRIAWAHAHHRHHTRFVAIPVGVPVFTAGRRASGHIVLSVGDGWVRSTDWPRDGRVGTVRLATLLHAWHHHYLGWSEDLNGVRVWQR